MMDMFINIEPIVDNNREYVKALMLSHDKLRVTLNENIYFKDNECDTVAIYEVSMDKEIRKLRFHYRYGDSFQYFDWFFVDEMPLLIENKVLMKVYEKIMSKKL